MTLLFISSVYKTFCFCESLIRSSQCYQITTVIANFDLKDLSLFIYTLWNIFGINTIYPKRITLAIKDLH